MIENSKQKFLKFFQGIAAVERKIQMLKQVLSQLPDFTPATVFHRLDSERKGHLGIRDIKDFLQQAHIKHAALQLKTLFGRIDENSNGKLSMKEFQNFILPCQNSKLRYEVMRRLVYVPKPHEKLENKLEWTLAKFFTEIISEFVILFRLKKLNVELKSSHDFNIKKLFELLGGSKSGTVNYEGIKKFLIQNKSKLSDEEIGCILKQLDGSGDGEISLQDFEDYIATLKISRAHELFDDMKSFPAVKIQSLQETRDRQRALYQRFLDNELYRDLNLLKCGSDEEVFNYKIQLDHKKSLSSTKKNFGRSASLKSKKK